VRNIFTDCGKGEKRQGIGCMVRGGKMHGVRGRDELMGGCPLFLTLNW